MSTSEQQPPRLAAALLALPALTRETLSHLLIDPTTLEVRVVPDARHGAPFGGPLASTPDLEEQIHEVSRTGLWGTCTTREIHENGRHLLHVQLWDGEQQRRLWQARVDLAAGHPDAAHLLAAAAEQKMATWRLARTERALREAAHAAQDAGLTSAQIDTITNKKSPATDLSSITTAPTGQLVRLPVGRTLPCVICTLPATDLWGTEAVHRGECLRQLKAREDQPQAPDVPSSAPEPTAPADQAPSAQEEAPADPRPTQQRPPEPRRRRPRTDARFRAIAAAIATGQVFLTGGEVLPWEGATLADAAALAATLRLGHGGGRTLPHRGEVWIYPDTLEAMGLPVDAGVDSLARNAPEQRKEKFGALMDIPAVADLQAQGWELVGERIGPRTVVTHPEKAPGGVALVVPSWGYTVGVPLLAPTGTTEPAIPVDVEGDDELTDQARAQIEEAAQARVGEFVEAPELVERLQDFADHVGVPWEVAGGITGQALIDHTHPPRARASDPIGSPAAVVRNVAGDFPAFLRAEERIAPRMVESNFSWWRPWDSLSSEEQGRKYVHAYDHRSHYLNPWGSTDLGLEGLTHHLGDDAVWDGTEKPGYYLVSTWEWEDWGMPDPGRAGGYRVEDGIWVTPHTLRQLEWISPGFTDTLTYFQAYRWEHITRYLEIAGKRLRDARNNAPAPVADTVKLMYAMTVSKFASRELRPNHHLFRPDWRDHIVGASRNSIVLTLMDVRRRSGAVPLVVDRDLIVFASDEADPAKAWPGNPEKFAAQAGGWKPEGCAPLAQWGPKALDNRRRIWPYARHMDLMHELGTAAGLPQKLPATGEAVKS